jgi:hypothetical protein
MIRAFATYKPTEVPVIAITAAPIVISVLEDNIVETGIVD